MPKHLPSVCRRRYSFVRWLECEMNKPPFWIHPESNPVSDSKLINKSRVVASSWISTSLGRSRQTKPAVCHVVPVGVCMSSLNYANHVCVNYFNKPAVSWARSRSTALTFFLVSWYKVFTPADPPPTKHDPSLFIYRCAPSGKLCLYTRQTAARKKVANRAALRFKSLCLFFSRSINFLFTQMISGRVTVWLRAEHHRVGVGRCKQSGGLRGRILIATMKTTKETSWEVPDGTWDRF